MDDDSIHRPRSQEDKPNKITLSHSHSDYAGPVTLIVSNENSLTGGQHQKSITTQDHPMNHHIGMEGVSTTSRQLEQMPQLNDELNDFEIPTITSKPYSDIVDISNGQRQYGGHHDTFGGAGFTAINTVSEEMEGDSRRETKEEAFDRQE